MNANPRPRLRYTCPQCKRCILRVFTPSQHKLGRDLPAAVHDGLQPGEQMSPLSGTQGIYSASLERLRAKGSHISYLGLHHYPWLTQDDIAVACRQCGAKYSVMVTPILEDFLTGKRGGILPTRRGG
jgi:hypothetical protein